MGVWNNGFKAISQRQVHHLPGNYPPKENESQTLKTINDMKPNQTIIDLAKSYGFDGAEFECEWNGYKVFNPTFDDPDKVAFIGKPILILHDGNTTRIADEWEWQDFIEDSKEKGE